MSYVLRIYIGPYAEVPRGLFNWFDYDDLVSDGRMEAATPGEPLILIPNESLPGIDRQMSFDRYSVLPVVPITLDAIRRENIEFVELMQPIIDAYPGKVAIRWGVVPRQA